MIRLKPLTEKNLNHAMMVVTEAFDRQVMAGDRSQDSYDQDWFLEHEKFQRVVLGAPYAGVVGYEGHTPVAVGLLSSSLVYPRGTGVIDWFYVSPVVKASSFPLRMCLSLLKSAGRRGLSSLVAYVGVGNPLLEKCLQFMGLKPVEIEYRGEMADLNPRFLDRMKRDVEQARN